MSEEVKKIEPVVVAPDVVPIFPVVSPPTPLPAAPQPRIQKMFWPFPLVWIIPLLAAALAGYYLYQHHQENGVQLNIVFEDGAGLKPGETVVALRGVPIGHVRTVELSDDHSHAIAHVQLASSAEYLARAETLFWMVKPELSLQNISGLNTLVSGAYIDCRPGDGPICHTFDGLKGAPVVAGEGLHVIVSAEQIGAMTVDSPVTYRGIQVGIVKDIRLSTQADAANITLFIWERYRPLVRSNSVFWMLKGADLSGSIFSGLKLQLGSVQSLLTGGVAFATPEKNFGPIAREASSFVLHDRPDDDWVKWKAKIPLPPQPSDVGEHKAVEPDQSSLPTLKHE